MKNNELIIVITVFEIGGHVIPVEKGSKEFADHFLNKNLIDNKHRKTNHGKQPHI